jgi:hypothetical protein
MPHWVSEVRQGEIVARQLIRSRSDHDRLVYLADTEWTQSLNSS